MIMIKIEMWPRGDESRKRDLAAIAIANVGGDSDVGDYQFAVSHQIDSPYGARWSGHANFAAQAFGGAPRNAIWKVGTVRDFVRQAGVIKLLAKVLRAARL